MEPRCLRLPATESLSRRIDPMRAGGTADCSIRAAIRNQCFRYGGPEATRSLEVITFGNYCLLHLRVEELLVRPPAEISVLQAPSATRHRQLDGDVLEEYAFCDINLRFNSPLP